KTREPSSPCRRTKGIGDLRIWAALTLFSVGGPIWLTSWRLTRTTRPDLYRLRKYFIWIEMVGNFLNRAALCLLVAAAMFSCKPTGAPEWPEVSMESRPWTPWWWHGSAVTKEGITAELEALKRAGIGGVEITPIYGVYGEEDQFVEYLSPQWVDLLRHTLDEAARDRKSTRLNSSHVKISYAVF